MEVVVQREGKTGILGLGTEEAVVVVTPLPSQSESDIAQVAENVLEKLLALMNVSASVSLQAESGVEGDDAPSVAFDISGDDLGILIGRRGQTLSCLQYIVRLVVGHQTKDWVPIVIDVEGYKQRRYQTLQAFALRIAEQVKLRGGPFAVEPMPAHERRIIHITLADDPDVTTESIGEGEGRRVVVLSTEE